MALAQVAIVSRLSPEGQDLLTRIQALEGIIVDREHIADNLCGIMRRPSSKWRIEKSAHSVLVYDDTQNPRLHSVHVSEPGAYTIIFDSVDTLEVPISA